MQYDEEFRTFIEQLEARLELGVEEYGDESFLKPPRTLLYEIQEELLDVCNWSFIMWKRLNDLKARL